MPYTGVFHPKNYEKREKENSPLDVEKEEFSSATYYSGCVLGGAAAGCTNLVFGPFQAAIGLK